jgi:monoamine oxidase
VAGQGTLTKVAAVYDRPFWREHGLTGQAFSLTGLSARRPAVLERSSRPAGPASTRGCPVGIPSPGTLVAYGSRIREPVGRLHWAGTETSDYWNGYMDGAVRSGERVAAEVLAELLSRV